MVIDSFSAFYQKLSIAYLKKSQTERIYQFQIKYLIQINAPNRLGTDGWNMSEMISGIQESQLSKLLQK